MRVEMITPSAAKKYLEKMIGNRPLSEGKTIEYGIAMEKGNWRLNGETIKFDADGRLFDGQHRLQACILAEKSFKTYVVHGITDPDAFATVDVGKGRSAGDIFGIAGYPSSTLSSGAAMLIWEYKNGQLASLNRSSCRRAKKTDADFIKKMDHVPISASRVTKEQLLHFCEPFKDRLIGAVRFAQNCKSGKLLTAGMIAGCYFLFAEKSDTDAKAFFDDLCSGAGLATSDPVYRLRERLIDNKVSNRKYARNMILAFIFKAWNKRRAGEKAMSALRVIENEEIQKIR